MYSKTIMKKGNIMNEVHFSDMNHGAIITIDAGERKNVYLLDYSVARGWPEEFFNQISQKDLEEIGGQYCYSITPYTRRNLDQVQYLQPEYR